jgi:ubiquinone/menaquinone biosynthesis C-methylase UbiE
VGIERADYGFDAPPVLAGLAAAAAITTIIGIAIVRGVLIAAALLWVAAGVMAWASRVGKRRWAAALVDGIPWRGDERVLDVGCGRGLIVIEAAKRLTEGHAFGADIWSWKDQSGNRPDTTRRNATAEGVGDRVEIVTADASWLPFRDGAFDVVVSGLALHNIRAAGARRQAMRELARVVRPAGRVAVFDIQKSGEYMVELAAEGLTQVTRSRLRSPVLMPIRTVTAARPSERSDA